MKYKFLLLLSLISTGVSAQFQGYISTIASEHFQAYIKGGCSVSAPSLSVDFPGKANYVSFYIGGDLDIPVSDTFKASLGYMFTLTGSENAGPIKKLTLHNLQYLFAVKYYPAKNVYLKPGVYGTYIIKSEMEDHVPDDNILELINVRDFDYGLLFGIGYEIGHFSLESSYSFGMANLFSLNGLSPAMKLSDPVYRNRYFQFGIAYRIK